MGFNFSHHPDEDTDTKFIKHVHQHGKVPQHYNEIAKYPHDKKDDRYNDKVIKVQSLDKLIAQNFETMFGG
ncbi:MAG: hypothetical protein ABIT58_08415 [Ferruginibacter sp.]